MHEDDCIIYISWMLISEISLLDFAFIHVFEMAFLSQIDWVVLFCVSLYTWLMTHDYMNTCQ